MSERKPDIDLRTNTSAPLHNLNPSEAEKRQHLARMVQVGSRGVVASRTNVNLPPELYGEWVDRMDVGRIHEYELMGFKVDTEYAANNRLHSDGTGVPLVGDTTFMTIPRWMKENLDIKLRMDMERNNPTKNSENDDLTASLQKSGIQQLNEFQGSSQQVEGIDNIQALLNTPE